MRKHGKRVIEKEINDLGKKLEDPITCYLIGGGAMALKNLKNTTKDIDIVIRDKRSFKKFIKNCLEHGYHLVKNPPETYIELGAQKILEKKKENVG